MTSDIPDRAKIEAHDRSYPKDKDWSDGEKIEWVDRDRGATELARVIAKYEDPVDPDLKIAREAAARVMENCASPGSAVAYRSGQIINSSLIQCALEAIKMVRAEGASS